MATVNEAAVGKAADNEAASNQAAVEQLRREVSERYGKKRVEPIEAGRVRDYLLAMNESDAGIAPGSVVPPLFLLTLGRRRRPEPSSGTAVKANDDFTFHAPVHVGDVITVTSRLADIQPKQGKMGPMFLVIGETSYHNQHGQLVGVSRGSSLRWGVKVDGRPAG